MESLIKQTYDNTEIIVIDDCSTDRSAEVLAKYQKYSQVHITLLKENGGYAKAGNLGVDLGRGNYVMFAECDDFSEPEHVEILMEKILKNSSVGVVYCRSNMVDGNGLIYGTDFQYREKLFQAFCSKDILIPQKMIQKFFLISCVVPNMSAAIIKKEYLTMVSGFNPIYKACSDWDFWCRIAEHCDFYYVSTPLNNFRNHPTTVRNTTRVREQSLEIFSILYDNFSKVKLTYIENMKFKLAIGSIWGMQISSNFTEWIKSFYYVWRHSLRYDNFIVFYLIFWIAKEVTTRCYARINLIK